jgi:hypothetical protein
LEIFEFPPISLFFGGVQYHDSWAIDALSDTAW